MEGSFFKYTPFSKCKYNEIFNLISKNFLTSNQHQLRILGLKILNICERKEDENINFLNLIYNFSFDEKWNVRESLIDILKSFQNSFNFSNLILLYLCEDDIELIQEIAQESINNLNIDIWKEISIHFISNSMKEELEKDEKIFLKKIKFNLKILNFSLKNKLIISEFEMILESIFFIFREIEKKIELIEILKEIIDFIFKFHSKEVLNLILNNLNSNKKLKYFKFILNSVKDIKEFKEIKFKDFKLIFENFNKKKEEFEFIEIIINSFIPLEFVNTSFNFFF